jgi:hypothetical protein
MSTRPSDADKDPDNSNAPTDADHAAAGDGTLQGSVPAGASPDQLREIAENPPTDDGGTG